MNFAHFTMEEAKIHRPRVVVLDEHNRLVRCEDAKTTVRRTEREVAIAGE
jgi:aspartate 1-decarboxylase